MSEKFYSSSVRFLPFVALIFLPLLYLGSRMPNYYRDFVALNPIFLFLTFTNRLTHELVSRFDQSLIYMYLVGIFLFWLGIWLIFIYGLFNRSVYAWWYMFILFLLHPVIEIIVSSGQIQYFVKDLLKGFHIISVIYYSIYWAIGIPFLLKLKKYYH